MITKNNQFIMKYEFIKYPETGKFGEWKTADGFNCYTDKRSQAVRWYKKHLKNK